MGIKRGTKFLFKMSAKQASLIAGFLSAIPLSVGFD